MKKQIFVLLLSFSSLSPVFAQENTLRISESEATSNGIGMPSGLQLGLEYANIQSVQGHFNTDSKTQVQIRNDKNIEMAGIRLGYLMDSEEDLGANFSLSYLEAMQNDPTFDNKFRMVIPAVDLNYRINSVLSAYVGGNYAIVTQSEGLAKDLRSEIGAELGVGFKLGKNVSLLGGYRMLSQSIGSGIVNLEGFASNLSYIF